jgi:hypothetical protein
MDGTSTYIALLRAALLLARVQSGCDNQVTVLERIDSTSLVPCNGQPVHKS